MVSAPYGDAFLVQKLSEVVRMYVRQRERDDARTILLGAVERYVLDPERRW